MRKLKYFIILIFTCFSNCDYLDVVPDGVATIDNAFTMRKNAEKYLFTCYRYMPSHADLSRNPAFTAGDEFWFYYPFVGFSAPGWDIARGNQNATQPVLNYWDNMNMFIGIRDCNIFLENINTVPDMDDLEKERWIGEVKFLKAYYHFWLLRMYGPIPLIRENLPISAGVEEVKVSREPIDDCFDYIVQLIDEAIPALPLFISADITELGRITQPIARSVKALALVTSASPMFNGNSDYTGFTNNDGKSLFNTNYDAEKWIKAAKSCEEAINSCDSAGMQLYSFSAGISQFTLSERTKTQMSIRNAVCEKWNSEIIWGNTNSMSTTIQRESTPHGLDPSVSAFIPTMKGNLAPPIKMAELFYTKNGIPISEDKTWDYTGRFDLKTATSDDEFLLQNGYTTVKLHFDREARFYASLAFDGGLWYGQGRLDDKNQLVVQCKSGQYQTRSSYNNYSVTGYWPKKLVNWENIVTSDYVVRPYPWPVMRLADLYLLYAESLNEAYGPSNSVYGWINKVRERAALLPVEEAWPEFSSRPQKHTEKDGLREIIQRERLIELAFEGHRFWDLRRWKLAQTEITKTVSGWDIEQSETAMYYRERILYKPTFLSRDYLWPIKDENLIINPNLVQNIGW